MYILVLYNMIQSFPIGCWSNVKLPISVPHSVCVIIVEYIRVLGWRGWGSQTHIFVHAMRIRSKHTTHLLCYAMWWILYRINTNQTRTVVKQKSIRTWRICEAKQCCQTLIHTHFIRKVVSLPLHTIFSVHPIHPHKTRNDGAKSSNEIIIIRLEDHVRGDVVGVVVVHLW